MTVLTIRCFTIAGLVPPGHVDPHGTFAHLHIFLKPNNMKKVFFSFLLALPLATFAQNATIKIDVNRTVGQIDPKIYGVFMEPCLLYTSDAADDLTRVDLV